MGINGRRQLALISTARFFQRHPRAGAGILIRQIIGGEIEIALTDNDRAPGAGFELARIVLIENTLGSLNAARRDFSGTTD
jgi:hypothetical protein